MLGKFIRLRKDHLDYAALLLIKLEKLIKFANRHNFTLTFLGIPIYSIKEYNASRGHSNPDKFVEQDKKLKYAIQVVNEEIAKLNTSVSTHSPKFSCDLLRNCHNKRRRTKYFHNFSLYKDGLHPKCLLSKFWVRRIAELVKEDCF